MSEQFVQKLVLAKEPRTTKNTKILLYASGFYNLNLPPQKATNTLSDIYTYIYTYIYISVADQFSHENCKSFFHPWETEVTHSKLYAIPSHIFVDYCMEKIQREATCLGANITFPGSWFGETKQAGDEQINTWQHLPVLKLTTGDKVDSIRVNSKQIFKYSRQFKQYNFFTKEFTSWKKNKTLN
jgi:hypothetical protein